MLISQFLEDVYLTHRPSTSDRTKTLYRHSVSKFGKHLGRPALLLDFENSKVGKYLIDLLKIHTPATVQKERCQLLAIWRDACETGDVVARPRIQGIKVPDTIPKALTVEELKRLVESFDKLNGATGGIPNRDVLRAVFLIQFATGERIGAVSQLRWSDVAGNVVTFRAETRKGGRRPSVKTLPDWAVAPLKTIAEPKRELIFPGCHGTTKLHRVFDRLFKSAGVDRPRYKSSHLLRSTHATLVHLAGGDAARSLGHASPTTTHRHYIDGRHDPGDQADYLPEL